jgi:hypothetical protein
MGYRRAGRNPVAETGDKTMTNEIQTATKSKPAKKQPKDFTGIKESVRSLGHLNSPYYVRRLGYSTREIEAAVKAGALRWTSAGNLEVA